MAAKSKVASIQAHREKRGHKTRGAWLQGQTLAQAHNHGTPWSDDEKDRLAQGVGAGETAYELALALGRSYYSTITARGHIAFCLRHWDLRPKRVRR